MRLLVCGGRDYGVTLSQRKFLYAELDRLKPSAVIQGGASGADARAREWARYHDIPCVTFEADWRTHGKAAGPIRNQRMIDEGKPDMVLAFPGGRGTADMVRRAMAAKIPLTQWLADEVNARHE